MPKYNTFSKYTEEQMFDAITMYWVIRSIKTGKGGNWGWEYTQKEAAEMVSEMLDIDVTASQINYWIKLGEEGRAKRSVETKIKILKRCDELEFLPPKWPDMRITRTINKEFNLNLGHVTLIRWRNKVM